MAKKTASHKSSGKTITKKIAEKWVKGDESIDFCYFKQLDEDAAKVLVRCNGWKGTGFLGLNGLTQLSDGVAKILAGFKGSLDLEGLSDVSESVARNLAKTKAELNLDGLKSLSDSVAKALASHNGPLTLRGLGSCSDLAVKHLAARRYDLTIGLPTLSDAAARALSSFRHELTLSRIRMLSDSAVRSLERLDRDGRLKVSDRFCKTMARLDKLGFGPGGLLRFAGWTLNEKKMTPKSIPDKVRQLLRSSIEGTIDAVKVKITKVTLLPKGDKGKAEEYFIGKFLDDYGCSSTFVVSTNAKVPSLLEFDQVFPS